MFPNELKEFSDKWSEEISFKRVAYRTEAILRLIS